MVVKFSVYLNRHVFVMIVWSRLYQLHCTQIDKTLLTLKAIERAYFILYKKKKKKKKKKKQKKNPKNNNKKKLKTKQNRICNMCAVCRSYSLFLLMSLVGFFFCSVRGSQIAKF